LAKDTEIEKGLYMCMEEQLLFGRKIGGNCMFAR
jgi:hypothetical protein